MRRARFSCLQTPIEEPTIYLTPLLDVVFVVLIMFIVIAPLVELEQVHLTSGGKAATGTPTAGQIRLYVHKNDQITLNNRKLSLGELKEELSVLHERYPGEIPQLFHDHDARFGTYQAVKNSAEEAGFLRLDLVVEPK